MMPQMEKSIRIAIMMSMSISPKAHFCYLSEPSKACSGIRLKLHTSNPQSVPIKQLMNS